MSRYNSYIGYFKKTYGERLQKVVVDAGFTCPNRDGLAGRGGCTYCDNAAFHPGYSTAGIPIHEQIDEGIKFHRVRYRKAEKFLAYFQPYSQHLCSAGQTALRLRGSIVASACGRHSHRHTA